MQLRLHHQMTSTFVPQPPRARTTRTGPQQQQSAPGRRPITTTLNVWTYHPHFATRDQTLAPRQLNLPGRLLQTRHNGIYLYALASSSSISDKMSDNRIMAIVIKGREKLLLA